MLHQIQHRLKHLLQHYQWYSPLSLFHIIFFIIFFVTIPFSRWFLGWDALSPELNFGLNFSRAFSAMWQENYGLGVLGGHGFAATLPHTTILYLLSFVIPQMLLRSIFTMLCFYLGGLGMYFLVKKLLGQQPVSHLTTQSTASYIALFSAFFYMGNLGTIQMFYVQLEAFIVQFAALPWLFLCTYAVLEKVTAKRLLIFLLVNFLASIQGFIPSLFIAYGIALGLFLLVYTIQYFSKTTVWRSFLVLVLTGLANCYWLVPLAYYQVTRSGIFLNAYNNLISTPHFVAVNKKYGDVINVGLLKGFMFDSFELGGQTMGAWAAHQSNLLIPLIGITFFALSVFGFIVACMYLRRWKGFAFAGLCLFFFVSLTTATPPFSWFTDLMQHVSPTYYQAFRTSFTKFSIGLAFSYSIFLSIGLLYFLHLVSSWKKVKATYILGTTFALLFLYTLPIFSGNLIYPRLFVEFPKSYLEVIKYFKTQPDGRIADFPQDCAEGWYAYKWGYFGSGFYWYGIKQPILARSFDVWSNTNENYYWEITQALREKDYQAVEDILDKYQVQWVLYDPNLLFCRNQRPFLLHEEFVSALKKSSDFTLTKTIDDPDILPIQIYARKNPVVNDFVGVWQNLPVVAPAYTWSDTDGAFHTLRNYQSVASPPEQIPENTYIYPFRNLFTKRPNTTPVAITRQKDTVSFRVISPQSLPAGILTIPPYQQLETVLPATMSFEPQNNTTTNVYLLPHFPTIQVGKTLYTPYPSHILLGTVPTASLLDLTTSVNGQTIASPAGFFTSQLPTTLFTTLPNTIAMTNAAGNTVLSWTGAADPEFSRAISQPVTLPVAVTKGEALTVFLPRTTDPLFAGYTAITDLKNLTPHSCNNTPNPSANTYEAGSHNGRSLLRLSSLESSLCLQLDLFDMPTDIGYVAFLSSQNVSGDPLRLVVLNKNRTIVNDTYLAKSSNWTTQALVLPPVFPKELGLDVHIDNISENKEKTVNAFGGLTFFPIPYTLLTNMVIAPQASPAASATHVPAAVSHPSETYYAVSPGKLPPSTDTTLVLSQSFDPAWQAYMVDSSLGKVLPFVFGKKIQNHVLVNNWENGWEISQKDTNTEIVIVFLPQYLQYIAYMVLVLTLGIVGIKAVYSAKQ